MSSSGFPFTINSSSNGSYTITLNNITADVTFTDMVLSNGVIHLIDTPLINISPNQT